MKKTVGFIIILVMAVFCSFTVCAVGDAPADYTVTASQPQVGVGDTVTINITITAVKAIGRTSASVTYDTTALTFVSGNGATDQGGVINIELPNGLGTTAVLSLNFTAAATGSASVNVTKCCIYDAFEEGYELQESKGVSVEVAEKAETTTTTTEETTPTSPQTDANGVPTQGVLVDLKVDQGSLVPPFMYSIHEYSVTVPYDVEKVEVDGKTASTQDHIWYTGNPECVVGRNVRTITVTDINGNETVYTIYITRLDKDQQETKPTDTNDPAVVTSSPDDSKSAVTTTAKQEKNIKDTLLPALYIVLIVLVVSLFIIILWIKNKASKKKKPDDKSDKQRSKIKVSGSNTRKKK